MLSPALPLLQSLITWLGPPFLVCSILYAVATAKTIPFAWHARVFYAYFGHYYFAKRRIPVSTEGTPTLFQPTVYTTGTPVGDLDYSLHKSNSTYLVDLDLARASHFFCLFRVGLEAYSKKGRIFPALGAITCTFKREIRPFEKVDIWTRVLSWDAKWIYLVSHFVKAGTARPSRFTDQPWRRQGGGRRSGRSGGDELDEQKQKQAVPFATCISKYVVKLGRKTVPPGEFLAACGLLGRPGVRDSSSAGATGVSRQANGNGVSREEKPGHFLSQQIEERRQRGLGLANHVASIDEGQDWFTGDGEVAFARY